MKRHGENLHANCQWKKSIWKGYILYDFNYTWGNPRKKTHNYLLAGNKSRLPPLGECCRNPSVSVYQLVMLWEAVFGFNTFFWRLNMFAHFMMGYLWVCLPTLHWVLSTSWPKTAWPPCPTLPIHPISPKATFLFPWMEKSPQRKHFINVEEVKALKVIKTDEFKNCFEPWLVWLSELGTSLQTKRSLV